LKKEEDLFGAWLDMGGTYKRSFPCQGCGTLLQDVYPPDDIHTLASRYYYPIPSDVCLAVDYKCRDNNCGRTNTIYWYSQQAFRRSLEWYDTGSYSGSYVSSFGSSGVVTSGT
jgi:hypothetical protein